MNNFEMPIITVQAIETEAVMNMTGFESMPEG